MGTELVVAVVGDDETKFGSRLVENDGDVVGFVFGNIVGVVTGDAASEGDNEGDRVGFLIGSPVGDINGDATAGTAVGDGDPADG